MSSLPKTVGLPMAPTVAETPVVAPQGPTCTPPVAKSTKTRPLGKLERLSELQAGETGRVVRLNVPDAGCRKRFAELGLAEGMKVTVATTGDTLMLILGSARMGIAARCAQDIMVLRI